MTIDEYLVQMLGAAQLQIARLAAQLDEANKQPVIEPKTPIIKPKTKK